ncbi:MAG: 23S rRNA (pseudouridine(1915)-N(3))-methyltransferase RlmH [Pseudomonadota bacterium]
MKLIIAAIGKSRPGPLKVLTNEYCARAAKLSGQFGFKGPTLVEKTGPNIAAEATALLSVGPVGAVNVALDETGENLDTVSLMRKIVSLREQNIPALVFHIGGADGHGQELLGVCGKKISFGAATWPHMLVRVMLAEQLYRVMTALAGHPYHRE